MKITKLILGTALLLGLGAAVFAVRKFRVAEGAKEARAVANQRNQEMRAAVADLESKFMAATKRAEAVESDNAALASAVAAAQVALAKPVAAALTKTAFAERLKQALEKSGDPETARRELLWCVDTAAAQPALVAGGQMISIIRALMKLSERHPMILADLRERFEAGKRRVLQGDDTEPLATMGMIARELKDEQAMVAVLDGLPAGDARRKMVTVYAVEGLIVAKRYDDVLAVQGYGMMSSSFERITAGMLAGSASAKMSERAKAAGSRYAVTSAAKNIEVLAGAGDLVNARKLAGQVLAFDGSEATRALLQKHLERAGRGDLLAPTVGK